MVKPNAALGDYIIAFQSLEHELINLFTCLIDKNNPHIGEIISSKMSFNMLIDVLDAIVRFRVKDPELIEEMSRIMVLSLKFQEERNSYVHSYYNAICSDFHGDDSFNREKKRIKRGKGYELQVVKHDPDKLVQSERNIYGLIVNILNFAEKLKEKGHITDVYDELN